LIKKNDRISKEEEKSPRNFLGKKTFTKEYQKKSVLNFLKILLSCGMEKKRREKLLSDDGFAVSRNQSKEKVFQLIL
jgi:hypothetical protein